MSVETPPLTFERWSDLSVRALVLPREEFLDLLEDESVPPADYRDAGAFYVVAMSEELSRGERQRATAYAARCAEALKKARPARPLSESERALLEPPPAPPGTQPPSDPPLATRAAAGQAQSSDSAVTPTGPEVVQVVVAPAPVPGPELFPRLEPVPLRMVQAPPPPPIPAMMTVRIASADVDATVIGAPVVSAPALPFHGRISESDAQQRFATPVHDPAPDAGMTVAVALPSLVRDSSVHGTVLMQTEGAGAPGAPAGGPMSLEHYARMGAALAVLGADQDEVLRTFGVPSPKAKESIDRLFGLRFQTDPRARREYEQLVLAEKAKLERRGSQ